MALQAQAKAVPAVGKRWVVVCRVLLGLIFLLAGTMKLGHTIDLAGVYPMLGVLPSWLAGGFNVVFPAWEILIGLVLVSGWAAKSVSSVAAVLIAVFMAVNIYGIVQGVSAAGILEEAWAKCGCLGPLIPLNHWQSLGIDLVMVGLALPILLRQETRHGNV